MADNKSFITQADARQERGTLSVDPSAPNRRRSLTLRDELESLRDVIGPAPLVDLLLERCFVLQVTDIHFDPRPEGLQVRVRLDGILQDIILLESAVAPQVVSRIKLMAGMDITEKRLSQDGHIASSLLRQQRDVRVGSGPTIYGERLVLRLMPDGSHLNTLGELGLDVEQMALVERAVNKPFGAVLSVGPVGSGKSTTTYSCLNLLCDPGLSLVTIEDPVERRIKGVNQIQIDPRIDFGFVQALRGVLRQDPDVIMVGEIRDAETARIAIRAGLTGTRVLSTLHAGDTGATLDMFREFDIPRIFIADAVNGIIAQRLLRKNCEQQREFYAPDAATRQLLRLPEEGDIQLVRGVPSEANYFTGYAGRTGIFEVMFVDADLRDMILEGKSGRIVQEAARQKGMSTLEDAAVRKVVSGLTSVEELHRVLAT